MKLFRYFGAVLILFAILASQSCGNNNTDTSGNLTVGTPTTTTASCGVQTVSATITYTPPALVTGPSAVPNGVQVAVSEFENGVLMHTHTQTLTDSPTFTMYYTVSQQLNTGPTQVVVSASIGSMNSSAIATIAAFINNSGCSH
jgi:hypothetical protein